MLAQRCLGRHHLLRIYIWPIEKLSAYQHVTGSSRVCHYSRAFGRAVHVPPPMQRQLLSRLRNLVCRSPSAFPGPVCIQASTSSSVAGAIARPQIQSLRDICISARYHQQFVWPSGSGAPFVGVEIGGSPPISSTYARAPPFCFEPNVLRQFKYMPFPTWFERCVPAPAAPAAWAQIPQLPCCISSANKEALSVWLCSLCSCCSL